MLDEEYVPEEVNLGSQGVNPAWARGIPAWPGQNSAQSSPAAIGIPAWLGLPARGRIPARPDPPDPAQLGAGEIGPPGCWSGAVPGWAGLAGEDAGPPGQSEKAAQPGYKGAGPAGRCCSGPAGEERSGPSRGRCCPGPAGEERSGPSRIRICRPSRGGDICRPSYTLCRPGPLYSG
jgi:hypothetical protein